MKKISFALLLLIALPLLADDPGNPGPFAVTREEYNFGDTAFTPTNFPGPVEVTASVHYPTGLPGGPYPLVVFLHGRHATCFVGGAAFLEWPCVAPRVSIPSAPWPTAGHMTSGSRTSAILALQPSRLSPAAANRIAV